MAKNRNSKREYHNARLGNGTYGTHAKPSCIKIIYQTRKYHLTIPQITKESKLIQSLKFFPHKE